MTGRRLSIFAIGAGCRCFFGSFGKCKGTATDADFGTFDQAGLINGLTVDLRTIAALVVPHPPSIFISINFGVNPRTLRIVEDNLALPIATQQILPVAGELKSRHRRWHRHSSKEKLAQRCYNSQIFTGRTVSYESGGRKKPNGSGHQQYNLLQFWQDLSGYCNLAGTFGPLESPAKFASNREPRTGLNRRKRRLVVELDAWYSDQDEFLVFSRNRAGIGVQDVTIIRIRQQNSACRWQVTKLSGRGL